jgi:hypothetical protein
MLHVLPTAGDTENLNVTSPSHWHTQKNKNHAVAGGPAVSRRRERVRRGPGLGEAARERESDSEMPPDSAEGTQRKRREGDSACVGRLGLGGREGRRPGRDHRIGPRRRRCQPERLCLVKPVCKMFHHPFSQNAKDGIRTRGFEEILFRISSFLTTRNHSPLVRTLE